MTTTPTLNLDVYITPMKPMQGAPAQGPGDEPMWSPMSATLIHGDRDAVLVDTLVTFDQVGAVLAQGPATPALAHLFIDSRGFCWLSEDDFVNHFASDVEPTRARVMHAVQQAVPAAVVTDRMCVPAWRSLPAWYLVAENDEAIPPDTQRQFAERMGASSMEVPSSHLVLVSHPQAVAELIGRAAAALML